MGRRRTKRAKKRLTLRQRIQDMWPDWQLDLGPLQSEVVGLVLLILAALTILGLSDISSGAFLDWWATLLRRIFGWGAYAVALSGALLGLWLLWRDLRERVPIDPAAVIGLELLLLVALVSSHVPLVVRAGIDEAFIASEQGQAGGYVGWALAIPLVETLGLPVGIAVLFIALAMALYLVLPVSWPDLWRRARHQSRLLVAAFNRWRLSRQGAPVVPEVQEAPWWEEPAPKKKTPRKKTPTRAQKQKAPKPRPHDTTLPPLDLLDPASPKAYGDTDVRRKTQIIEETLASFSVPAKVVEVNQGPTVTQFGLDPGYIDRRVAGGEVQRQRVRVAKIASLSNDLALALAAAPIRIEAPVPGRSVVGLEVPNEVVTLVSLRGVMESPEFRSIDSALTIALGEDVSGHAVAVDLAGMPHLLIAGATGSGKSVCINSIVCCLLLTNTPEDLKMLMIDPKMVELVGYNGIPHLLAPVVIEVEQVVNALSWVTRQMDERYKLFHKLRARNLEEYNQRVSRRKPGEPLPKLVIFIDELADLMMVAPDDVERHICRVAQMGRATGIHLVVATQRPSVDVVTGLIKANFPARISFAVTSQVDSRVILDQGGAETLLGRGDMLFLSPQQAAPNRLQGCFVSDKEIHRLTEFWRVQRQTEEQTEMFPPWTGFDADDEADSLLNQAIKLAEGRETISTSFVQRQLRVGFPRAARLMDQLEDEGIVGPDRGGGRGRRVLIGHGIDLEEIEERLPGVEPD
jgi:S-DNA-T family DNA segregation ATPase FtsK/SpoIIIE